jgi:hypothetical protein
MVDSEHPSLLVPDQDEGIQAPLSALQRLALQRRQAGSSPANNATDKPGGLAGLAKGFSKKSPNVGIPPATGTSSSFVSPSTNLPPKTSKLSALAQKSASLRANSATKPSIQSDTSTDTPLSKLALRIKAQKDAQEAAAPPQTETDAHKPESNVQPSKPEFEHFGNLRPIDTHAATDVQEALSHKLRTGPSLFGNILAARQDSVETRVSLARIYSGIVSGPPSAFQFNTPSPDDAVMAAREGTRLNALKKASNVVGSRK